MADVIYVARAGVVRQVKTLTLTGVAVGAKWTVTVNAKSVSYTAVTGDTNDTAAAALAAAMTNAVDGEINELESVVNPLTLNQIVVTGPADGSPFLMTTAESGGAVNTVADPTAFDGPHNAANVLNYSTGGLPGAGDRLVFDRGTLGPRDSLTALAAVALLGTLTTDGFDGGTVGRPDDNPKGYREYRGRHLQVQGSITVQTANQTTDQRLRFQSVDAGDVPVVLSGPLPAAAGGVGGGFNPAFSIDIIGTQAGSTVDATNVSFTLARNLGETTAIDTLTAAGCVFQVGPSCAVAGECVLTNCTGRLQTSFAGIVVNGGGVAAELAAASSGPVVVDGGTLAWRSSGNPSATTKVNNGGTLDFTGGAGPVAVTTFEMGPQSTINDSTGRVTMPFDTRFVGCSQEEVTLLLPPGRKATWAA